MSDYNSANPFSDMDGALDHNMTNETGSEEPLITYGAYNNDGGPNDGFLGFYPKEISADPSGDFAPPAGPEQQQWPARHPESQDMGNDDLSNGRSTFPYYQQQWHNGHLNNGGLASPYQPMLQQQQAVAPQANGQQQWPAPTQQSSGPFPIGHTRPPSSCFHCTIRYNRELAAWNEGRSRPPVQPRSFPVAPPNPQQQPAPSFPEHGDEILRPWSFLDLQRCLGQDGGSSPTEQILRNPLGSGALPTGPRQLRATQPSPAAPPPGYQQQPTLSPYTTNHQQPVGGYPIPHTTPYQPAGAYPILYNPPQQPQQQQTAPHPTYPPASPFNPAPDPSTFNFNSPPTPTPFNPAPLPSHTIDPRLLSSTSTQQPPPPPPQTTPTPTTTTTNAPTTTTTAPTTTPAHPPTTATTTTPARRGRRPRTHERDLAAAEDGIFVNTTLPPHLHRDTTAYGRDALRGPGSEARLAESWNRPAVRNENGNGDATTPVVAPAAAAAAPPPPTTTTTAAPPPQKFAAAEQAEQVGVVGDYEDEGDVFDMADVEMRLDSVRDERPDTWFDNYRF